jgi:hypothetical protein
VVSGEHCASGGSTASRSPPTGDSADRSSASALEINDACPTGEIVLDGQDLPGAVRTDRRGEVAKGAPGGRPQQT